MVQEQVTPKISTDYSPAREHLSIKPDQQVNLLQTLRCQAQQKLSSWVESCKG